MKINFKETPKQVELFRALASKDFDERREANEAFAEFLGPIAQKALAQAPTLSNAYTDMYYDRTMSQTIALDSFYDIRESDYVRVWSQSAPGGLPTNQPHSIGEIPFISYSLNTAVSIKTRQAEEARFDAIGRNIARAIQELLVKQERDAAKVILDILANAETSYEDFTSKHVIRAGTAGAFKLTDMNKLGTLVDRLKSSFLGGTSLSGEADGITTVYISPEILEQIKNFAFNPLNSKGTNSDIPGTEQLRNSIYNSGGLFNFQGTDFVKLKELGVNKRLSKAFKTLAGNTTYDGAEFNLSTEELIIGINESAETLLRPVETETVDGMKATVTSQTDNQWVNRSETLGWTLGVREGRISVDSRDIVGLIV